MISYEIIATFSMYLFVLLAIGLLAWHCTNNVSDYILGGRKMGPMVTALSVGASDMSGWLLLGLPGAVYLSGLSAIWIGVGLFIGATVNWLVIAKRIRIYTVQTEDSLTLPDFFEKRFHDTGLLRLVSALAILLFFVFYTSAGMISGALLFQEVFGLSYYKALVIGSTIIVSYTFLGGFFAVSWTDFFQGLLMLAALFLVPLFALLDIDIPNTVDMAQIVDKAFNLFPNELTLIVFLSYMAWGLGYFGQPHILARFMAIKSIKDIPLSRNVSLSWMFLSLLGACMVGVVGMIFYGTSPIENPETVFIQLSKDLFSPWIAGLLMAAILSAIMSTIDSQLLVCSSVFTEDFYTKWLQPHASDKEKMWVSRFTVIIIALLALFLSLDYDSKVLSLVEYAWGGFGGTFGPLILLSLYWKNYSKQGAIATVVSGALTIIIWDGLGHYILTHFGKAGWLEIFQLYEIIPAFIMAISMGVLFSRLYPVDEKVQAEFDRFMLNN